MPAAAPARVLIADDDDALRELLVLNLQAEGMQIFAACDGDEAHRLALQVRPNIIVLDVMMPMADGLHVLNALKANPATADIPVVLLTAKATDAEIWEGWRAGADYYITKPFKLDELINFINYLSNPVDDALGAS